MKHLARAGYGTACLLVMAAGATPALAADGLSIAKPAALLPSVSTVTLGNIAQPAPSLALPQQFGMSAVPAAVVSSPAVASPALLPAQPVTTRVVIAPWVATAPQPAAPVKAAPIAAVPLRDLVISYIDRRDQDAEQLCLANAVYFEARSEPLEGQLAVAQVVLNRAASGTFPTSVCEVVTQPAQFSFVLRGGKFPTADKNSECWHRALAIADIARKRSVAGEIASNVLWYHATYVSPSWGRQRTRFAQIGQHIFFS